MANPTRMQPKTADPGLEKLKNTANLEQTKLKLSGQQVKPQQDSIDEALKSPENRLKMELLNAVAVINYLNKANIESMKTQSVSAVVKLAGKAKSAYKRLSAIFKDSVSSSGKKLAENDAISSKYLALLKASKEIADKIMELNKRIVALNEKKAKFASEQYQEFLKIAPHKLKLTEEEFAVKFFGAIEDHILCLTNKTEDSVPSSVESIVERKFGIIDKAVIMFFEKAFSLEEGGALRNFIGLLQERKAITKEMNNLTHESAQLIHETEQLVKNDERVSSKALDILSTLLKNKDSSSPKQNTAPQLKPTGMK